MKNRYFLLIINVALLLTSLGSKAQIENLDNELMINTGYSTVTIEQRMDELGVPGLSIVVIKDYKVLWAKGYGVTNTGSQLKVTKDTIFQVASISKVAAATAALTLVDEGRFTLQTKVNSKLTQWKIPPNKWSLSDPVRVYQLLSHTAGLTVSGFGGYVRGSKIPSLINILQGVPPANSDSVIVNQRPGEAFKYSGGGTEVMQLLLRETQNKEFVKIVKNRVLDPLQMNDSFYGQPIKKIGSSAKEHPTTGYLPAGANAPVAGRYNLYPEFAAAGLWSTAPDLAKMVIALQKSVRGTDNSILTQQTAEKMMTAVADIRLKKTVTNEKGEEKLRKIDRITAKELKFGPSKNLSIGLGLFLCNAQKPDEAYFFHSGVNYGFYSRFISLKHGGDGVVILTNGSQTEFLNELSESVRLKYKWNGSLTGCLV
jgi:CubicO group peptidase (beta-lactamase class C family)